MSITPVELFFAVLAYIWLAYAGYRSWTGTASATARVTAIVLVGLLTLGLSQDLLDIGKQSSKVQVGPYSAGGGTANFAPVEVEQGGVCVGVCKEAEQGGRYVLSGNWISGDYTLRPHGTQPYALSFKSGVAEMGGRPLSPGCSSGEISDETNLQFGAAKEVRLEIGPGARCAN